MAELGNAFQGQGPNLQVLLDNSSTLNRAATEDIPQTSKLIGDGQTVLATQAADSGRDPVVRPQRRAAGQPAGQPPTPTCAG